MAITIDVNVGDVIMGGRFKNKPIKVKSIGKDEHGMPTINGRKVVNFRLKKFKKKSLVIRMITLNMKNQKIVILTNPIKQTIKK